MKSEDEEGDVSQIFVEMLEEDIKKINEIPKKKMIMGEKDSRDFRDATKCWICNGSFAADASSQVLFKEKNEKKVRDHCISLENIVELLTTNVISNSRSQSSVL